MSPYGFAVMGALFAADVIYTFTMRNKGFMKMGKSYGVSYAVPRIAVLVLLPYWAGSYLIGKNSALIQIIICFALSAALMSLEYYLQKKSEEIHNSLYIPAYFVVALIILLFADVYGSGHDPTVKNRFIYSLSGLSLAVFSSLAYSAIKSKVSDFRYGTALTLAATAVSSLTFGMVTGVIISTCLG